MTRLRIIPLALLALMLLPRPDPVRTAVEPIRVSLEAQLAAVHDAADKPEPEPAGPVLTEVGRFRVSHYTPAPGENGGHTVTSQGEPLEDLIGLICAAHPDDFGLNALIHVEGYGILRVADRGVPPGHLDVLVATPEEAYRLGVAWADVSIVEEW